MQSVLADVSPNEEFTTSLGVDQSLRITCQPVEVVHNTRSGLLGNKVASITYTHHFRVKNTKTHSVSIQLYEQVPLSSDDRVKVQISITYKLNDASICMYKIGWWSESRALHSCAHKNPYNTYWSNSLRDGWRHAYKVTVKTSGVKGQNDAYACGHLPCRHTVTIVYHTLSLVCRHTVDHTLSLVCRHAVDISHTIISV